MYGSIELPEIGECSRERISDPYQFPPLFYPCVDLTFLHIRRYTDICVHKNIVGRVEEGDGRIVGEDSVVATEFIKIGNK